MQTISISIPDWVIVVFLTVWALNIATSIINTILQIKLNKLKKQLKSEVD